MSSLRRSSLPDTHPDYSRLCLVAEFLEQPNSFGESLPTEYPFLVDDTITQSIDATRTGRTHFEQLYPEERKNLGSLIEVRIRDLLGVPRSKRDLQILDHEVDVKNTIGNTWMIPRETYDIPSGAEPGILLLCQYGPESRTCNLGLIVARREYLSVGANRDGKVSVSAAGRNHIWWLVYEAQLPPDIWASIDVSLYRRLRQAKGGTKRAAEFFESHLGIPVERSIVQSLLFDQRDYMKRLRSNGGARDILSKRGISLRREQTLFAAEGATHRYYDFWIAEKVELLT